MNRHRSLLRMTNREKWETWPSKFEKRSKLRPVIASDVDCICTRAGDRSWKMIPDSRPDSRRKYLRGPLRGFGSQNPVAKAAPSK
jgi:hypothetical protein